MSEESRLGRESIEVAYALKAFVQAGVRVFLYLEDRERAVQIARRVVGADTEDVVHDVTLYLLLEKRDYLRDAPGEAYFLTAVKHTALRRLLYAWARYVVVVDPETLLLIEQMTHPARVSRPNTVRLSER